jgi:hypothetical protein
MGEAINGEIPTIDSQDLIESGIVVYVAKHHRVDVGERLIDVLGQYFSSPSIGSWTSRAHLEQVGRSVDQLEDCQRDARVLARTNASVVSELGKCFPHDYVRHRNLGALLTSGEDVARGPGMMAVASIDCRNE